MKTALLALALALSAFATTTVQSVTEVSAQQALLRYRTTLSPATACSWAVTESISGATPDDANTSVFSSSNLDTRAGSIINGTDRVFVLGLRTSAVGADGLLHSRSLKANTAYTAAFTCGSDTGTVHFSTQTIPAGPTYFEQPPYSSAGFGNWAWPTINWGSQSTQYADPQTGVVLQRMTSPGWWGQEWPVQNFGFAVGGSGWTNPQDVLNGSACGTPSTSNCAVTTNSNSILVVPLVSQYSNGEGNPSGYAGELTYDDGLITLTGLASASGAEAVTVTMVCFDSVTACPGTAAQTITLGTSLGTAGFPAAGVGYSAPNNTWTPQFDYGEWTAGGSGLGPRRADFAFAFGNTGGGLIHITASSTAVSVNCVSGEFSQTCFNVKWNNSFIYIQGSGCTDGGAGTTDVCQVSGHPADAEHLTLKNAPPNSCNPCTTWQSLDSGYRIAANGTGTVSIGAQYSFAYSAMFTLNKEGDEQICNPVPIPGAVGYQADGTTAINPPVPGNLCTLELQNAGADETSAGLTMFLLIPSTGETRLLSPLYAPPGSDSADAPNDQNAGQIIFAESPWDGVSGLCLYGLSGSTHGSAIYKGCYDVTKNFKAYSHPLYACGGGFGCYGGNRAVPGQDPTGAYPGQRWSDDPMVYTNIMPGAGKDVISQVTANNPSFAANPTVWNNFLTLDRILNGKGVITFSAFTTGTQGAPQSFNFFDLATGNITGWGDTFFNFPTRFGGFHTSFGARVSPGYWATALNYLDFPMLTLGGPYQSTPYWVCTGPGTGSCSTNTALTSAAPLENCANYSGIPAAVQALITQQQGENRCMHVRMQNVVNQNANATEAAAWPSVQHSGWGEPLTLAPGDMLSYGPTIGLNGGESGLVAAVTAGVTDGVCSSDCLDVVIVRGMINCSVQNFNCSNTTNQANGWVAVAGPVLGTCSGNVGECTPGVGIWFPVNGTGLLGSGALVDPPIFGGHADLCFGPTTGHITSIQGSKARYDQTLASQVGTFNGSNVWAGAGPVFGNYGTITLQSYVSCEQQSAPSKQRTWSTDYRHINPGAGSGGEQFIAIDPITYSLVGGTTTVYDVTAPAGGLTVDEANYKRSGLQGWAGPNAILDISGPSSSLTDSTAYQTCLALAIGECRSGSAVGAVYAAVPHVPSIQSNCVTDWIVENYPCIAVSMPSTAGWLVQNDASYSYSLWESGRRITSGLTGIGRQYQYSTFICESTGTWCMFKADWADGLRSEVFGALMPPLPSGSTPARSGFLNLNATVPCTGYAEAQFGYAENGPATSYFATPRQDVTDTSGSPFRFESVDSRSLQACSDGSATVAIPGISGRVMYYRVGTSLNGTAWGYGQPQVGLIP